MARRARGCLLGYGAARSVPARAGDRRRSADADELGEIGADGAQTKLKVALEDGVLKIMAKMGISTLDGYRRAQVFEVLGLDDVGWRVPPHASAVGGLSYAAAEISWYHTTRATTRAGTGRAGLCASASAAGSTTPAIEVFEALHAVVPARPDATERRDQRRPAPSRDLDGQAELYARFAQSSSADRRRPSATSDFASAR